MMGVSGETKLRRLLPSEVAAQIRAKILDGSFAPGDRLPPERELASQLHVNRSSMREALKKLEELRLVDIQQGSGTRVRATEQASFELVLTMVFPAGPENVHWIRELLELREVLLARRAAHRARARDGRRDRRRRRRRSGGSRIRSSAPRRSSTVCASCRR